MKSLAPALLLAIAGCATSETTGVVPTGSDTFMVGAKAMAPGAAGHDAAADAYKQAGAFCAERGRDVEKVDLKTRDGGFARFPNAQLEFKCVEKK